MQATMCEIEWIRWTSEEKGGETDVEKTKIKEKDQTTSVHTDKSIEY